MLEPRRDSIPEERQVQTAKGNPILKKDKEGDGWTLLRDGIPADTTEWNKTLNALVDLRATEFVATDGKVTLRSLGLSPASITVTITKLSDSAKVRLLVGKVKDKVYAKREDKDTVYEVPADITGKLERPDAEYHSKALAAFSRYDLHRIKLQREKDPLEIERSADGWAFVGDKASHVDKIKVDDVVAKLQDTKIVDYQPKAAKLKPENTALVVSLFEKKDGKEMEKVVLRFSKPKAKKLQVERQGLDAPFSIAEADFRLIDVPRERLLKVEAKPVEPPAGAKDSKAAPAPGKAPATGAAPSPSKAG